MHESGAFIQCQATTHHVDGCQFCFRVARRNVDDQPVNLAVYHSVQRLLYHLVMRRHYHLAAGTLLEEVAGKVKPVLFALYPARIVLLLSSRHPPTSPAGQLCIHLSLARPLQSGRRSCPYVREQPAL